MRGVVSVRLAQEHIPYFLYRRIYYYNPHSGGYCLQLVLVGLAKSEHAKSRDNAENNGDGLLEADGTRNG